MLSLLLVIVATLYILSFTILNMVVGQKAASNKTNCSLPFLQKVCYFTAAADSSTSTFVSLINLKKAF